MAMNPSKHGSYGKDFADLYDELWAYWGDRMWPIVSAAVRRHVPAPRKWLDLCCGGGSLLKRICAAGYSAVGVDSSPHQLRYARRNAPAARLVRADVRRYRPTATFDVVTCLFDSLNYLTRKADVASVFRGVRRMLAPEGLFAFDVNTVAGLRRNWGEQTSTIRDSGRLIVRETNFDEKKLLACLRLTGFVRTGRLWRRFDEEHVERGYTEPELETLLAEAGFSFRKLDGHRFCRPRKSSGRLLYICVPAK